MYKNFIKVIFDFIFALLVLSILSPVFIIITIALFFSNKGKPFFVQSRPGKNEKLFKIIKFRTMNGMKDTDGNLLPDFQRLTFIGKMVRITSLDEIPQLINVLKGDMSLVGPRPLLEQYLPLYNEFQKKRHKVRPGITGWAQVNGRNALSWEEKFKLDVWYVDRVGFALDMKIIFMTFEKVIAKHGINADNFVTMEPFKGNAT